MSNFRQSAYNPRTKEIAPAYWMDDHFAHYEYGVFFDGEDKAYRPNEVEIPLDKIFVEKVVDTEWNLAIRAALRQISDYDDYTMVHRLLRDPEEETH